MEDHLLDHQILAYERGRKSKDSLLIYPILICRMANLTPFHCIADSCFSLGFNGRPSIRSELYPSRELVDRDMGELDQRSCSFPGVSQGLSTTIREPGSPLTRGRVWG